MKKINKYIIMALSFLALQGCDSFLDNKPKGFTIPEYFDDYVKLMNNQSIYRTLDVYPAFLTDDARFGNKNDQNEFALNSKGEEVINVYKFKNGQIFTPGDNDGIWKNTYSSIFTYNAVINNVLTAPDGTEKDRQRLKAEALFGRAYELLNLVNVYGRHYDPTTAKSDYGVPILTSETVPQSYSRATVEEVYSKIFQDLEAAIPNLSDKVPYSFRPAKSVGDAFYARLYLYMGNYPAALESARKALASNNYLLDYKGYTYIKGQWRRIVSKADPSVLFLEKHDNPENLYTRLLNNTSYIFKGVCASQDLLDVFAKDLPAGATDQRLELFYGQGTFNPGNGAMSFPGYTMFAPYIEINVGFSTPEMYLIAAECEARIGSKDNAVNYINQLRDMRIIGNTPLSAGSNDAALQLVLEERRREFALMGITRLVDLKRLNRETRFAKTITHSCDGESWTLPANDPRYIMPVPLNVLDYNPGMPQYQR